MTTTALRDHLADLLMHHVPTSNPADLRVVPVGPGRGRGWDIALILDGGYIGRLDAQDVAEHWRELLQRVLTDLDETPAAPWLAPKESCPACGKPSRLVRADDRYYHCDGTVNQACWIAIVRGETNDHH
jgi:hypothetical protein